MYRWGLLAFAAAACALAVSPSFASADTTSLAGETTTVTCTFDPSSAPGVTTCSQRTDVVRGPFACFLPAVSGFDSPVLVFQHDDDFSSRVYRGRAVSPALNGVPVTADLGVVPLSEPAVSAYDDAIYALVVRPHAHLESDVGWTNDRFGTYPVYLPVVSCN